jgi:hypothetical protein
MLGGREMRSWYGLHRYTQGGTIMEFEGYCVKCREKRTIQDGKVHETAKGRRMAKGTCPVCETKVTRFLPSKDKA